MADTVVYSASKIITMDPTLPEATHVAVRDGLILAVGTADCARPWGDFRRDDRYRDAVLMPGFVEGHAHMMTGAMWNYAYAGYQDRIDPDGRKWEGLADIAGVMAGLKRALAELPAGKPLIAWGFDPIFLPTERLNRRHLDEVSSDLPIVVMHSNFHLMTANSAALSIVGYDRNTNAVGVASFDDGEPSGELQEMAAMFPLMRRLGMDFRGLARTEFAMRNFAKSAMRVGVTTSTDLLTDLPEDDIATLTALTGRDDFQLRIVPALNGITQPAEDIARRVAELRKRSTDKLRLGAVKLMADGSIQGYTGRLKWPGYVTGHPNGIWNTPPDLLKEQIVHLHREGVQMHIHVNGDEASEAALDALEEAQALYPRFDHRHTLQHCQMADDAQFRRMAALDLCVNLFANHIWYFGDQHYERTMGPDRAMRLDACGSALRYGVPLAIHSDSPVTPLGPLHVAWCAVNRLTPSGRVLGENQKISVEAALHAITLGAAFTLKLDSEIGSIETGKKADFAVLGQDPFAVPAIELRDIPVLGTVMGGHHFPI
ncbi:amidohydrolase [Mesorhizobium koreense]|jgi:predicted amidohydrolase YtcJ|uniref:amidohydrolase n=1 Tax=Mesorhizobium koreense TaxID=3074855 RepID=UPI00287BA572|nr:amidohydrolase [Mesorhizobium sp. WR6]